MPKITFPCSGERTGDEAVTGADALALTSAFVGFFTPPVAPSLADLRDPIVDTLVAFAFFTAPPRFPLLPDFRFRDFHRILTAFSVRPGSIFEIAAHLLPSCMYKRRYEVIREEKRLQEKRLYDGYV